MSYMVANNLQEDTLGKLIIVSNCDFEHEVTKVTSGKRKSLVFFLVSSDGENPA